MPLECRFAHHGHHHVTPAASSAQALDALLAAGASVNIYMFHGGTNFGLTSGANDKGTYQAITTSYDYDAPLDEAGQPTEKYRAYREVLSRYAPGGAVPAEVPVPSAASPSFTVPLPQTVPMWNVLDLLGSPSVHERLPTADDLGQYQGFTLYETEIAGDDGSRGGPGPGPVLTVGLRPAHRRAEGPDRPGHHRRRGSPRLAGDADPTGRHRRRRGKAPLCSCSGPDAGRAGVRPGGLRPAADVR
ncbi:MAG TPA: beta-galactosidase [Trebonia sp.]